MNVEDLLLSTQTIMSLQESAARAEGREFTATDAMHAARPALEAVLGEILDLQRSKGNNGPDNCPGCGYKFHFEISDIVDDYDNVDAQEIIDLLDDLEAEEIRCVHEHEKTHQARGSVLSAATTAYSNATAGQKLDDDAKKEQDTETSRVLDKMFADLFKDQV